MKRMSGRVLLGAVLSGLSGLSLFAMASCSASSSPQGGVGAGTSFGGAASTTQGGATSVGGSGTQTGLGGSSTLTGVGGGVTSQGGTSPVSSGGMGISAGSAGLIGASGGSGGGTVAACSTDPNLVNATGCFVGCDPASSTDNPDGLQGAFYTYGDGPAAGPPKSCPPLVNPPCSTAGVCITGKTFADKDYATGWGCGIGFELNDTGGAKQAYTGPATCFTYSLTGSSGGNEVRLSFTQSADTANEVSPYLSLKPFTTGATGTICTKDVSCPTPPAVPPNCTAPTPSTPYDLQIQVVGGNNAGSYNVCLTSLVPVTNGTSTLTQLCGAPGSANGSEAVGKYFVQNNVNNDPGGTQCITPSQNGASVGFKIDSSSLQDPGNTPAAYPSIVDGWHYGKKSTDSALPILLSKLASANSSATYTGSNGKYDASYDIWVLPNATATTPNGGLEVMLWLNDSGVQPNQTQGSSPYTNGWTRYISNVSGGGANWKYVAYVKTGQGSFNGDLAPFIQDAATQTSMTGSYLAGIEFGFELWQSGNGFSVSSFSSTVVSK